MDRCPGQSRRGQRRFPRTRGDGPVRCRQQFSPARAGMDPRSTTTDEDNEFPPHARGWTRQSEYSPRADFVSPARAGMDPLQSEYSPRADFVSPARAGMDRLTACLTVRGCGCLGSRFPPHARGWTLLRWWPPIRRRVSPARAGMDRWKHISTTTPNRFPRTRGDGPYRRISWPVLPTFPPHARGWTAARDGRSGGLPVSPARAGMDLSYE